MMNNVVLADNDDEYILINDFYMWNAYQYWKTYGYDFKDTANTYTNTLNTITQSTSTGSFTFTGSFGGSFEAAVNLHIISTIGDTQYVAGMIWNQTIHFDEDANQVIEMTITPSGNGSSNDYNATYGCVFNPQNNNYTCTPDQSTHSTPLTIPSSEVTVDTLDLFATSSGSVTVALIHEGDEVGTLQGSLSLTGSGNGNLSMTENGTATTTSVNRNTLSYVLPWLHADSVDNSWNASLGDVNDNPKRLKVLYNYPDDPITFIFMSDQQYINSDFGMMLALRDITSSGTGFQTYDKTITHQSFRYNGGGSVWAFSVYTEDPDFTGHRFLINWNMSAFSSNSNFMEIIPLYVGRFSGVPDDLYRFAYGKDRTIEAINSFHNDMVSGNQQSQDAASSLNYSEQGFVESTGNLIDFENNQFTGMDSAIDNIQLDNNLIAGNGFLNAANWVRVQFDNLISFTPLQSVLVFSLSLGFALLIIGKVR